MIHILFTLSQSNLDWGVQFHLGAFLYNPFRGFILAPYNIFYDTFCETLRFAHIPIWKEGPAAVWAGLELEHVLLPYCIEALRQPNIAYKSKKVSQCRLCFFLELFTEYTECQAFCACRPNWDPPKVSVFPPGSKGGEEQHSLAGWGGGPNSDDWTERLAICILCGIFSLP